MTIFVGREVELLEMQHYLKKKTASLLVVKGRRRIGKSTLVDELAKDMRYISISGLPPTKKTTKQSQLQEFSRQFSEETGLPRIDFDDWGTAFFYLAKETAEGRVIILLDEISWMGSKDPDFLGKLKHTWDKYFKKNNKLILILCSSASSWIEKNVLSSTGFLGRVSFTLKLEELPLKDCMSFWERTKNISVYEKLKILAVTGGVPKYLEEINPKISAEENIRKLCFTRGGILVEEFDNIFNNLFLAKSEMYKKLTIVLSQGAKDNEEICRSLKAEPTGRLSGYLKELEHAGFVKKDFTWDIKHGLDSPKLFKYRLSDNYLRFYLKYIEKNRTKIERNAFRFKSMSSLPGWESIMGLQFENLVLNNREYLWNTLRIKASDIISENPFYQTSVINRRGCQIDYMIQTKYDTLYIFEIKFSKNPIGNSVISEVQEKINRLKRPIGMSCRPVLIHVNGVCNSVLEEEYFAEVINFSNYLE